MTDRPYFHGRGKLPEKGRQLPVVDPSRTRGGEGYLASGDLAAAVDVAIILGMPLLLTGEPGSGKSRLADRVAAELHLRGPWEFPVKSETRGNDLFYAFDTVGRFHAANLAANPNLNAPKGLADIDPRRFVTFNALGRAILQAKKRDYCTATLGLPESMEVVRTHPGGQGARAVVLIDEIDKAPRDVPNDLLNEIESLSFRIPEFETADGGEVRVRLAEDELLNRPLVIITSNSERALPEAFLRRCVFHHVTLPPFDQDKEKQGGDDPSVEDIVASRLLNSHPNKPALLKDAIAFFRYLRSDAVHLSLPPSLAELLNWLELLLMAHGPDQPLPGQPDAALLRGLRATLFKTRDTQQQADRLYQDWWDGHR